VTPNEVKQGGNNGFVWVADHFVPRPQLLAAGHEGPSRGGAAGMAPQNELFLFFRI